jgi:transposase
MLLLPAMKTISLDLRVRILAACDKHDTTQHAVATRFGISLGFVKKLLHQRKTIGTIDNLYSRVGRKPVLSAKQREQMRQVILKHPGATLAEIARTCHLDCSIATVDNTLRRMGLTYKKRRSVLPNKPAKTAPSNARNGRGKPVSGTPQGLSSSTSLVSRPR